MFCGWTERWRVLRKAQLSPEALRQNWERGAVTSASAPWVSAAAQACVSAVVLIQLPISAPGLTPPPGAHWPAPHPQPTRSAGEAVVCRLPQPRAWLRSRGGASPAGQSGPRGAERTKADEGLLAPIPGGDWQATLD